MQTNYIHVKAEGASTGLYVFTKRVTLDKDERYLINIFTTGRYILYINDQYICEGPCKSHEYVRYYDAVETDQLKKGENEIRIVNLHVKGDEGFSVLNRDVRVSVIFEAYSNSNRIVSDRTWECYRDGRYELYFPESCMKSIPPCEKVTYGEASQSCEIEESGMFDFSLGLQTRYGIVRDFHLEKRPIPMIYPGDSEELNVVSLGENYVELDAGKYVTAKLCVELAANVKAKIIYAECYEQENGKGIRDDASGFLRGMYDVLHTHENAQVFETFWFRAFRFVRIETDRPIEVIKKVSMKICHYPAELTGGFECSDERYNKIYDICVNSILCCAHETFVDCPHYEQQQYIMDSTIEAAVLMKMTPDARLVKKCISEFAVSQQPGGLLRCNYPNRMVHIIVGFSCFWIFMLKEYLDRTRDIQFVKQHVGCMDGILNYFDCEISKRGYISRSPYWDYVDCVPEWGNGVGVPAVEEGAPHTIYNLYYAYALLCAEELCRNLGRTGQAADYRERYTELCQLINQHCYDCEKKLYRDGGAGSGFSMHTIIWAVLAELVTGKEADEMLERLDDPRLSKISLSMKYYLFRALEKVGQTKRIFHYYQDWMKMLELHCTTWCEDMDTFRSECHGWGSAPLYDMAVNILGVKCTFEDEIVIAPEPAGLTWARGTVPTRYGNVEVSWSAEGDFEITVKAPGKVKKRLIFPDGEIVCFEEEKVYYSKREKM